MSKKVFSNDSHEQFRVTPLSKAQLLSKEECAECFMVVVVVHRNVVD